MAKSKKNSKILDQRTRAIPKPELHLHNDTRRAITIVFMAGLSVLFALSLLGVAGGFGNFLSKLSNNILGVISFLLPILFLVIAGAIYKQSKEPKQTAHGYFRAYFGTFLISGAVAGLIHMIYLNDGQGALGLASSGKAGGFLGALFAGPVFSLFGFWAGAFVLLILLVIAILITFNIAPFLPSSPDEKSEEAHKPVADQNLKINNMGETVGFVTDKVNPKQAKPLVAPKEAQEKNPSKELKLESIVLEDRKDWKLPPFDLLDDNKTEVDSGNIEHNVTIIQQTLADFGIEVEMGEVNVGPTVTQYTLRPAIGVKLVQIGALQNDLALALAAQSLRMELPIPGKSLVGIEVPNKVVAIVRLREVMQTTDFINHKSKVAIALGRDVAGRPQVTDLAKMPHLLIAGATGTGKSVAINSLFISLLYRNTPQDIKFIVVDPKRVELTPYNGIPHLLTPVITDRDKAVNALKWAVAEMDRRYKLLSEAGKRNITEYNESTSLSLSYIVIIVDELADLMTSGERVEVESAIVRLAQMARAVGIHLVLATQRPSVEVITGLIKANITSRVAFTVGSQVDSRTILDASGAEKLLGNGDMLFISADFTKPKRIQGAYIGEKEVKRVVDFFKQQAGAVIYSEEITEKPKRSLGISGIEIPGGSDEGGDDLYQEAKDAVMQAGKASASLLQRRLRVGYARAARLLDILEEQGVVGPADGAKPREVYGVVSNAEKEEYGFEPVETEGEERS